MEISSNESDTEDTLNIASKEWNRLVNVSKKVIFVHSKHEIVKDIGLFSIFTNTHFSRTISFQRAATEKV